MNTSKRLGSYNTHVATKEIPLLVFENIIAGHEIYNLKLFTDLFRHSNTSRISLCLKSVSP